MADEARATVGVDVDANAAKSEVSGLRGIFNSFFEGLADGARSVDPPIKGASGALDGLTESVTKGVFGGNLLTKVFDSVVGTISRAGSAFIGFVGDSIKMNASLEKSSLQFATLMGDADQAKNHVAFLFEFAKKTPFETGPIIEASRILQTFGGTALNSGANLTKFGDAAAATSAPLQEVSMWSGRLYAALQAGKPFGEAAQRLGELAIMTPRTRMELEAMQKSGASGEAIWTKYQESLDKFTGAMDKQSHTWEGLTSSISDSIGILGGRVFEPFFDLAKGGLERVLDLLSDKGVEGAITRFGQASGVAFDLAKDALTPLVDSLFGSTKAWAAAADSAQFNEKVVRAITTVIAGLVDGFAWLVRALATGVQAYYEFRIAGNLLLIGFGKVIEGIVQGALLISKSMAAITFGATKREWEASTARMSETLTKVQTDIGGLKEDTEGFRKKSEETGASMRGFADKLNVASANMRDHAQSYKYVEPEQKKVVDATKAVTGGFDQAGEAASKAKVKISEFAKTSSAEIARLGAEWNKQPAAIRANDESIKILLDKYEKLRKDAIGPLPTDLEKLRAEHLKALPVQEKYASNLQLIGTNIGLIAPPMDLATREASGLTASWRLQSTALETNVGLMPNMVSGLMNTRDAQKFAREQSDLAWNSLKGVSQSLANLAQIAPSAFKGVISGLASIAGAASTAHEGIGTIKSGFGALTAPGGGIGNMISGIAGIAGGFAAVASAAITAGKVVVSAFKSIFGIKDEWQKVIADISRDYKVNISEGLAKEIEKTSKQTGDRVSAILMNLDKVVQEAGGITAKNVATFMPKVHDLFSMVETGKMTLAQANDQLSKTFPQLAAASTSAAGLISKDLQQIIALDTKFGTNSKEVADFVTANMKTAMGGLNTFLQNGTIASQGSAEAMGSAVAAVFKRMQKDTNDTAAVLRELNPVIVGLQKQFETTGFTGGAAFNEISDLAKLASNDIVSKAMTSVSGLTDLMKGLHNSGLMDQQMFSGLSSQIGTTWQGLINQGIDGNQVMKLMQPTLQMLWEEQQKFGFTVDDTTQAMLDQAQQNGQVGSQYMSTTDRMIQITEHLDSVLTAMARKMGVEVAGSADEMGNRGVDAANRIAVALGGNTSPNADGVITRLNQTPWEAYGQRGANAASTASSYLASVGSAASNAAQNVYNSSGAFDAWADRAASAAAEVRQEIDGISFGASPGGIKEWIPMLRDARQAFGIFGSDSVRTLKNVKNEVNGVGGIGAPRGIAKPGLGLGRNIGLGGGLTLNLPNSVVANDQSIKDLARAIRREIANAGFLEERAEL